MRFLIPLLLGMQAAGLWDWTLPYSVPRIAAYVGVVALVGAFIASRFSPKSNTSPANADLLDGLPSYDGQLKLQQQEPEVPSGDSTIKYSPSSNLRAAKRIHRERGLGGEGPPGQNAPDAGPDLADQVVWSEREDVYRPAPVEARRFVGSLPLPITPEIKAGQTAILLRQQALQQIQTHLNSDLKHEQGGLLVGQAFRDEALSAYLLLIEEALPARGAVETETTIEYTADSWQALTPQLQQMDAAWTILGSYHSHPGHGVFLSATDRDTQGEVFSQDWQVALVVDPIKDKMGFFVGEKGTPCANWYVVPTPEPHPPTPSPYEGEGEI